MLGRFNRTMLILLLVIGLPYYWFFLDNSAPNTAAQPLTVAQLRALADKNGGTGPERIRFEQVSSHYRMGNRIMAGEGLRAMQIFTLAYMLEYRDGRAILIGSGISPEDAARMEDTAFVAPAQNRVVAALAHATMLVPLAQSPDQLGGAQMLEKSGKGQALAVAAKRQQDADAKGTPYALAPGVVVIPTPQLGRNTRLVYVRLATGREYLFAGALAPTNLNWSGPRLPARIETDFDESQDRAAIRSWLLTLRALQQEAPKLVIVSGSRIPKDGGLIRYFDESTVGYSEAK